MSMLSDIESRGDKGIALYALNGNQSCNLASSIGTSSILQEVIVGNVGPAQSTGQAGLEWYSTYLHERLQRIPAWAQNAVVPLELAPMAVVKQIKERRSLAEIMTALLVVQETSSNEPEDQRIASLTVAFALSGWLSMLYEPEFTRTSSNQIALRDVLDGYRSSTYFKLIQISPDCRRKLPEILLGFGLMLPKQGVFTCENVEDTESLQKLAVATPGGLNANTLTTLASVKIQWVDVIAPHLELDQATNTIFLYRYPSFCLANIPSDLDGDAKGLLHSLSLGSDEDKSSSPWASYDDVTSLMKEILLSYRLLFAQDRKSRKLFRRMNPFEHNHTVCRDPFLSRICTEKTLDIPSLPADRDTYRLSRDFPVLRERLAILQQQLLTAKPRGWKAVWGDRRETVQWWTFWAVMFFGGASLILTLVQVVLQGIQTSNS